MNLLHRLGLPFWSILIAIVLWVQVHGQGMGSVRMDVALQVRSVPEDMVIVNDLPDQVSITVSGLQAQLNALDAKELFVSVDASALNMPGVIEQALDIETIDLPVGLKVEKIQPDSVQLQVDHVVKRSITVKPTFDLPQGWQAEFVVVTPAAVELSGPEVWVSTLNEIDTSAVRLDLTQGTFDVETTVVPLSEKGIHLLEKDVTIRVRGELVWTPPEQALEEKKAQEVLQTEAGNVVEEKVSIVPVPEALKEEAAPEVVQETATEQKAKPSSKPETVEPVSQETYSNAVEVKPVIPQTDRYGNVKASQQPAGDL